MLATWKIKLPGYWKFAVVVILTVAAFILLTPLKDGSATAGWLPAKNLWDWIQLLLIPVVLAGAVFVWTRFQREAERQHADLQREIGHGHPA